MNKKTSLIIVYIAILLAIVITGCSKSQNQYINLDESSNEMKNSSKTSVNQETSEKQIKTITLYTDEQKKDGYIQNIAIEAFKKAGYEAKVEFMPWSRALDTVMMGKGEVLIGVYYTSDRAKNMTFSNSIGKTVYSFFENKNSNIKYNKLEDLKGYIIGIQRGVAINTEFDNAAYLKKEPANIPNENIEKLLNGRIDLYIEQTNVVKQFLKKDFPSDINSIVEVDPPLMEKDYFVAFSKEFPDYEQKVKEFNEGLKIITEDGTVDKIMEQYDHP